MWPLCSGARRRRRTEPRSHSYKVGKRIGLHLWHPLASVCLHRYLANAELATNLFIQQARNHQRHNLPFALRKRLVTVAEHPHLGFVTERGATAVEGCTNGPQQDVIAKGLRQEFDSPRLHSLDRHGHIAVARDEDDRHIPALAGYQRLKVQPIKAPQGNIQYEAVGKSTSWVVEEFLGGRECLRLPAFAADQRFQRFAHRDVIVDNKHDRRNFRHRSTPSLLRLTDDAPFSTKFYQIFLHLPWGKPRPSFRPEIDVGKHSFTPEPIPKYR